MAQSTPGTYPLPSVDIERLQLNPGAEDSLLVHSGRLSAAGQTRFALVLEYVNQPSVTRLSDGMGGSRLLNRTQGVALISHTANPWIQVDLQVPVILYQDEMANLQSRQFAPVAATGYGTPVVGARLALLSQAADGPLDLSLGTSIGLATGSADAFARDTRTRLVPNLALGRTFGRFHMGGELFARFRAQENLGYRGLSPSYSDTVTHEVGFAAAVSHQLSPSLRAELDVVADFALKDGGRTIQTFAGARYALLPGTELFAGAGPAFGTLVGTPRYRVIGGIAFALGSVGAPQQELAPDPYGVPLVEKPVPDPVPEPVAVATVVPVVEKPAPEPQPVKVVVEKPVPEPVAVPVVEKPAPEPEPVRVAVVEKPVPEPVKPKDSDRDGVPDEVDNCVREAGPKDNQGCPKRKPQLVIITKEKLVSTDKVYFAPGKATLLPKSKKLLDQVAKILKEHSAMPKVRVEGHTDNVGVPENNRMLSHNRAAAVCQFLIKAGVETSRLEPKGFGSDQPMSDNASAQGREANRRIEFVFVQPPPADSGTPDVKN